MAAATCKACFKGGYWKHKKIGLCQGILFTKKENPIFLASIMRWSVGPWGEPSRLWRNARLDPALLVRAWKWFLVNGPSIRVAASTEKGTDLFFKVSFHPPKGSNHAQNRSHCNPQLSAPHRPAGPKPANGFCRTAEAGTTEKVREINPLFASWKIRCRRVGRFAGKQEHKGQGCRGWSPAGKGRADLSDLGSCQYVDATPIRHL